MGDTRVTGKVADGDMTTSDIMGLFKIVTITTGHRVMMGVTVEIDHLIIEARKIAILLTKRPIEIRMDQGIMIMGVSVETDIAVVADTRANNESPGYIEPQRINAPNNGRKRSASPLKTYTPSNQSAENGSGSAAKRQNTASYNAADGDGKSKEQKLKEKLEEQGICTNHIEPTIFIRRDGWDDKMTSAAESTKAIVKVKMEKKLRYMPCSDEDSTETDDSSESYEIVQYKAKMKEVDTFIDKLPGEDGCLSKAIAAQKRMHRREMQILKEEKQELEKEVAVSKEKIAQLKDISKDLFDKNKRLESEMKKLGVVEKKRKELTDAELLEYSRDIREKLRYIVGQGTTFEPILERMKICVKSDPNKQCSFSLQWFLDYLYDKKDRSSVEKDEVFKITELRTCREVMFGNILTPNEVEAAKKDKKKPKNIITAALISEWNVVLTKNEKYSNSTTGRGESPWFSLPFILVL